MSGARRLIFVSADVGLLAHWRTCLKDAYARADADALHLSSVHLVAETLRNFAAPPVVWLDVDGANKPVWSDPAWQALLKLPCRWVAASSAPNDGDGIAALDAGCAAYCHAYSDAHTLQQVQQVVDMGQVWIGKDLMQRLISSANRFAPTVRALPHNWQADLTQRETEVAELAANGASNLQIAAHCGIAERTVKAHLSAVFAKLHITDRLQLALRVHGIS